MDITSLLFLFLFLPVFACIYLIARKELRIYFIVIANLIFLTYGQKYAIVWLLVILFANYGLGNYLSQAKAKNNSAWFWLGICLNLSILSSFKYWAVYGPILLASNRIPAQLVPSFSSLTIPLGLSYVTFQAIAYLSDIWKGTILPEKSVLRFSAYLLFFPKLGSGPLMRYKLFADQLNNPNTSIENTANGIRRMFVGFIKRALIANQVALIANSVFNLPKPTVTPEFAWLGLVAYTLQIYFDFSGYTDIAIGIGMIAGIQLPENFNFPYSAQSISDFWRRWHMSLTAWFREYVFYPLERRRFKWAGQQINFVIVFLLTGLWHGFKLTFIIWGVLFGIVLAVESLGFGRWLSHTWRPLRHIYTLVVIMAGWVFFRSNNLDFAFGFFRRLIGDSSGLEKLPFTVTTPLPFLEPTIFLAIFAGILFSLPPHSALIKWRSQVEENNPNSYLIFQVTTDLILSTLFIIAIAATLSQSFIPNIYASF